MLVAIRKAHRRFALSDKTKPQIAVPARVRLQGAGTLLRPVAHGCVVLPCPLSVVPPADFLGIGSRLGSPHRPLVAHFNLPFGSMSLVLGSALFRALIIIIHP